MPLAIYPGTFDPITFGHIDIAIRASLIFPRVIAVVADNKAKKRLFNVDERFEMVTKAFEKYENIEVIRYDGLIVDCLRDYGATTLIRGLRALSDMEYEFQMAFTNRNMNKDAETIFLMPSAKYSYLSSSMVKQIASLGGDVTSFVPKWVSQALASKYKGKK